MKTWKACLFAYLVVGLLIGLFRLFASKISEAYTTGNIERATFLDEVWMVVVEVLAWPVTLVLRLL